MPHSLNCSCYICYCDCWWKTVFKTDVTSADASGRNPCCPPRPSRPACSGVRPQHRSFTGIQWSKNSLCKCQNMPKTWMKLDELQNYLNKMFCVDRDRDPNITWAANDPSPDFWSNSCVFSVEIRSQRFERTQAVAAAAQKQHSDFRHCPCSHSDLGSQLSRPANMTGRQQFFKQKWLDFICVPCPKKSTAQCSACLLSSEISKIEQLHQPWWLTKEQATTTNSCWWYALQRTQNCFSPKELRLGLYFVPFLLAGCFNSSHNGLTGAI